MKSLEIFPKVTLFSTDSVERILQFSGQHCVEWRFDGKNDFSLAYLQDFFGGYDERQMQFELDCEGYNCLLKKDGEYFFFFEDGHNSSTMHIGEENLLCSAEELYEFLTQE